MMRGHRLCAGLACVVMGQAWGQNTTTLQPTLWVEPRVGVTLTATDNSGLSGNGKQADQILEVSPGVRMVANHGKVKGFLDYSATGVARAQGSDGDDLQHRLMANARINAIDNWAYVDVAGTISQNLVSAFGPIAGSSTTRANQAQTATYRISPYVRGELPYDTRYEARYYFQGTNTKSSARSDITTQGGSVQLSRQMGALGASVSANQESVDYDEGRSTETTAATARLSYLWSPHWTTGFTAGREYNDLLTLDREGYAYYGVDVRWRPSLRTFLSASVEDRYFGTGHNVLFEHRMARTMVRLSDSRSVSTTPNSSVDATLGTLYDLMDTLYESLEPDPVKRAQLVQQLLQERGLPGDALVSRSFLVSQATLQRNQQLAVLVNGQRGTFTVGYTRGNSRKLMNNLTLGDDFDNTTNIQTEALSFLYSHRLTPVTSANANYTVNRNRGDLNDQRVLQHTVSLGVNTSFSRRTVGGVQIRHLRSNRGSQPYSESALIGNILHRF